VAGDVDAARHPHIGMAGDMVEETSQRAGAGRLARDPAMQANAHHAAALGMELVEGVAQIAEELIALR
jgi:hypothetical protein